jgi:hypothetical protein
VDYVIVDGGFATAPFLHAAGELDTPVVARLEENLPKLSAAAQKLCLPAGHHDFPGRQRSY